MRTPFRPRRSFRRLAASLAFCSWACLPAGAVTLADQPVFATADVPGNLALVLSVEYPTAISVANLGDYSDAAEYLGYFDPDKCYDYNASLIENQSYFQPAGLAGGANGHSCSGKWSGNFMNWATMQTIDPFRWALSGGYRAQESPPILEKAWGSRQGSEGNFPLRGTDQGNGNKLAGSLVPRVTPFPWTQFNSSIWSRGNRMVFSGNNSGYSGTSPLISPWPLLPSLAPSLGIYQVYVRVRVCDPSASAGGLEANCVKYGNGYKPEGLLQQYSDKIRYSAFSYLNGSAVNNQGGVLRAPMSFIGPTYPTPLSTTVTTNPRAEWSATTGEFIRSPDSASAAASGVSDSGVINYLNKFGQAAGSYMTYDNVSELYYAAIRYFQNLGNVPTWTSYVAPGQANRAALLDGFPAVATWTDPILYSCQKNFILGIGDNHTHYDGNVAGSSLRGGRPALPAEIAADTLNDARTMTNNLLTLEGLNNKIDQYFSAGGTNATYYMAGLAYGARTTDIRPDLGGVQNIATYWMDVMEYQRVEYKNPYWLATKYGGFAVPSNYNAATNKSTPLPQSTWSTNGETLNMSNPSQTALRPDNYYLAGSASQMVAGLRQAFSAISNAVKAFTTSFSFTAAQVSNGSTSFTSQYDSTGWSSVVTASQAVFDGNGESTATQVWTTATTLAAQFANAGWDGSRRIVSWNGSAGIPFRFSSLTTAQQASLVTGLGGSDGANYLNYLRGDRSKEVGAAGGIYRSRAALLGDIVGSKLTPVAAPSALYSDAVNPGYAAFKTTWAARGTVVYAGANDGMLHAFNGAAGSNGGTELFAYVPSPTFAGPTATPRANGLAALGDPSFEHHFYVDATPLAFDIDFNNAGGRFTTTASANADWRTVLIGGLGKGGKGFYAIDVTNPAAFSTEAGAAAKVLWEFTDATMGYSFGAPKVVKTSKYGWVAVFTSGYNNSDGYGYLYFVNPRTGALLEKVRTPSASAGLAQATAYIPDYSDGTAESIYAGDLDGQLWRFDLTAARGATTAYPVPLLLARLTDAAGNAQPVTSAPLIEIHPTTRKRYVMLGTGQLLDSTDIASNRVQSLYNLIDGTSQAFNTGSALPAGVSFPILRSHLTASADLTRALTLPGTAMGWYYDLGTGSGIGWRVVAAPTSYNGTVAFTSTLTSGDACNPSGISRIYAYDYGTGSSILVNSTTGALINFTQLGTTATDLRFLSVNGTVRLVVGYDGISKPLPLKSSSSSAVRMVGWREIPLLD